MEKKSSGYQTGIASEHLVLSMLYRLGAKAYLTLGYLYLFLDYM